jgi:hypothetical protein
MNTTLKTYLPRPLAGLLLALSLSGCALTPMQHPGSDNWERELGAPIAPAVAPAAPQA